MIQPAGLLWITTLFVSFSLKDSAHEKSKSGLHTEKHIMTQNLIESLHFRTVSVVDFLQPVGQDQVEESH